MNINEILTLITLILGIPGSIVLLKNKKTKIICLKKRTIFSQEDMLNNIDHSLKMEYNNVKITTNWGFVKANLICAGSNDILSKNNQIEISLAKNMKWKYFKLINRSKGLNITSTFSEEIVMLDFGLFKSKENIEFEGIISNENAIDKKYDFNLKFFHRIPGIKEIVLIMEEQAKNIYSHLATGLFLLLFTILLGSITLRFSKSDMEIIDLSNDSKIEIYQLGTSSNYEKIFSNVKGDYNRFYLIFDRTKPYRLRYDTLNAQTFKPDQITKNISLKMNMRLFDYLFLGLLLMVLLMSSMFFYLGFLNWDKRKYFKYFS